MKVCHYCNVTHLEAHKFDCPAGRAFDTRHANASLEVEQYYPEPAYGQRLSDGFAWLHIDEDSVTDKFGNIRGSGNY